MLPEVTLKQLRTYKNKRNEEVIRNRNSDNTKPPELGGFLLNTGQNEFQLEIGIESGLLPAKKSAGDSAGLRS